MTEPIGQHQRDEDMRISALEQTIREGFARMEAKQDTMDGRLRVVEQHLAKQEGVQAEKLSSLAAEQAASKECSEANEKRIQVIETRLDKVEPWIGAVKWITGIVGAEIVLTGIGLLTHTI